jgi:hypothetical protein
MQVIDLTVNIEGLMVRSNDTVVTLRERLFTDLNFRDINTQRIIKDIKNVSKKISVNDIYIFLEKDSKRLSTAWLHYLWDNENIEVYISKEEVEKTEKIKKEKIWKILENILEDFSKKMTYEYIEAVKQQQIKERV